MYTKMINETIERIKINEEKLDKVNEIINNSENAINDFMLLTKSIK